MDGGEKWENEPRADLFSEWGIKLEFLGVGAHPWLLGRRNGLTRRIYDRFVANDRVFREQILAGYQWCLHTLISGGGYPAYQRVFGSKPADLRGVNDKDEDLLFA